MVLGTMPFGILSVPGIVVLVTTFVLIASSLADLRTGYIPDEFSLGLVGIMLLIAVSYSAYTGNALYLISSFLVGLLYFVLGYGLFYIGEWGGGDVKLISGVGASLGFISQLFPITEGLLPYYLDYLVNIALVSAPYVILYTLLLGLMNPGIFERFFMYLNDLKINILLLLSFIPAISAYFMGLRGLVPFYLLVPVFVLLSVYLKSVEEEGLQKDVDVENLDEEDVVAQDLVVDGEKIASKRDIVGLTQEDIEKIQELAQEGKIPDRIRIKWGVKFAPIFLLSYLLSILVGNALERLVVYIVTL